MAFSTNLIAIARLRLDLALAGVLAIAQVVALLWFATPTGLPLDDAWIHQVVARTFAETGTLGYAPGEYGAAATSYLWAALLGVNLRWFHVDPVTWAFALNVLAQLVMGQLLFRLFARSKVASEDALASTAQAFGMTLLACTSANILWFAHSGMEAPLFLALSITAVWAATAPEATVRLALMAGIASGLVVLTRPEGAPLPALLLAYVLLRRRSVPLPLQRALAIALPALAAAALYVGSNLAKTGRATPTTLSGRRWLWFEMTSGTTGIDRAYDFLDTWVGRLSSYSFNTGAAAAWLMLALAAYGAVRLLRSKTDGARLLFAWAALHTVSYVFMLPTPGHGGRYQPFVPLLYVACIAAGTILVVQALVRAGLRGGPRVVTTVALLSLLPWFALGLDCTASLRRAHALAVEHIDATELATGRFVDTLPPGDVVASFDIGGIGWATRRPILDAGGLSDPKTATLLEKGRIWEHLKSRDVRWIVLPEGGEPVLPVIDDFVTRLHLDNPAVRLTRVHETETPFVRWAPGIAATWNAAPKQVVYRIEYTGAAGPPDIAIASDDARRPIRDDGALAARNERRRAERSFAVLEAWGIPVSVQVLAKAEGRPAGLEPGCAIYVGPWGIESAGCDAVAEAGVLRAMLHEHVGRYLEVWDLGGALRAIPHVIARAKRLGDPQFHPPLAPVEMPNLDPRRPSVGWGLWVAFGGLALLLGIELVHERRLHRASATRSTGLGPAVLAALMLAFSCLVIGCQDRRGDVLYASTHGVAAMQLALARGANVEARDGRGRTPLLIAAGAGDSDVVALLLERGALASARDDDGASALHEAARGGHFACAALLARGGAPLELAAGVRKRTALHDATSVTSPETVRALLAAGASARAADAFGETALHLVARTDPARMADTAAQLLAAGADASVADARGFTALHAAAAAGHVSLLRAVLSGASADAIARETPTGETAIETALRYRHDLAVDALWRSSAVLRQPAALPPLHDAARRDAVDRVAALLAAGADPLALFHGQTALAVAHEHGSRRAATLLERPKAP